MHSKSSRPYVPSTRPPDFKNGVRSVRPDEYMTRSDYREIRTKWEVVWSTDYANGKTFHLWHTGGVQGEWILCRIIMIQGHATS